MTRFFLLASILSLLGLALWLGSQAPGEAMTPTPPRSLETAPPGSPSAGRPRPQQGMEVSPYRSEARSTPGDAPAYEDSVAGGVLVRTVAAEEPERPLGGTEVLFVVPKALAEIGIWARWAADPIGCAREHGRRFRTDAHGHVRVPRVRNAAILAVSPERVGGGELADVAPTEDALVIPMSAPSPLRARVVNDQGEGVGGIRVSLTWSQGEPAQFGSLGRVESAPESGAVVFPSPLLQLALQGHRPQGGILTLHTTLPGQRRLELEIPWEQGFDRQHEVRIPATGALVVRFLDPDDQPVQDGEGHVALSLMESREAAGRGEPDEDLLKTHRRSWRAGAPLVIPGVRAGRWLRIRAFLGDLPAAPVVLEGPKSSGEVVEATVTFPHLQPRYTFRVLDVSGEPVPRTPLQIRISRETRSSITTYSLRRTTDDQGRLSFLNRKPFGEAEGRLVLEFRETSEVLPPLLARAGETPSAPRGERIVIEDARIRTGEPSGVVILRELPLALAGVVVDGRGRPIEGAMVVGAHVGHCRTDARGRFWFLAFETRDREHQLHVNAAGHAPANRMGIPEGKTDVRVVLQREWRVEIPVIARTGVAPHLRLLLDQQGGTGGHGLVMHAAREGTASFVASGLAPGSYNLRVALDGHRLVRQIDGLRIGPEAPRDPRIDPLDLREAVRLVRIEVRAPSGDKPDGILRLLSGHQVVSRPFKGGRIELAIAPAKRPRAAIHVPGCRPLDLGEIAADRTVFLQRGLRAVLRVGGLPASLPPQLAAYVLIHQQSSATDALHTHAGQKIALEPGAEHPLLLPGPGTYTVTFGIEERVPLAGSAYDLMERAELVIEEADEGQVLEVKAPSGALEELARRLRALLPR